MKLDVRYQAAIVQDDHLLLLKVWDHKFTGGTFWVIPGGGRLLDETEEECVKREVCEETHLEVEVDRLILEEPDIPDGMYERLKTYACRVVDGDPQPGTEPEVDTPDLVTIKEVAWFDLRDPTPWEAFFQTNPLGAWNLQHIRLALGYDGASES